MRGLALIGLVLSLLLGAIAVDVTSDTAGTRRNEQDRMLQGAVNGETALLSEGERQTTTALSLMLVNPAVRDLLHGRQTSPRARREDLANSVLALTAIQRSAFVPVSAVCLDDGAGRELACGPTARPAHYPPRLGRQFAALAEDSAVGAVSGAFLSPVTNRFSVAFLAPFRAGGRLLGVVHLDISIVDARGASLIASRTPGVRVQLASYGGGKLWLSPPSSPQGREVSDPRRCRWARSRSDRARVPPSQKSIARWSQPCR